MPRNASTRTLTGSGRFALIAILLAGLVAITAIARDATPVFAAGEGTIAFADDEYTVTEGGTAVQITLVRTGGTNGGMRVKVGITPSGINAQTDLSSSTLFLDMPGDPNITEKVIDGTDAGLGIHATDDDVQEATATFTFTILEITRINVLGDPEAGSVATIGAQDTTELDIVDDDGPAIYNFSSATYTTPESGTVTITVNRSGRLTEATTVDYETVDNGTADDPDDFTGKSGELTFAVGQTSRTFTVTIKTDSDNEGDETFGLLLSNPSDDGELGEPDEATVTITDDDGPPHFTFATASFEAEEDDGTMTVTINRTGAVGDAVSVQLSTGNDSAVAPGDFTAKTNDVINFTSNQTSKNVTITIINDNAAEDTEEFTLSLSGASDGGTEGANATGVILDDDGTGTIKLSANTYTIAENGTQLSVTVQRTGDIDGGAWANYATSNGTAIAGVDYTASSGQVHFEDGDGTENILIPILNNTGFQGPRTFTITLSSPSADATLGTPIAAIITITDDEAGLPTITSLEPTAGPAAGGNEVTITGTAFAEVEAVYFGDTLATDYDVESNSEIVAVAPAGSGTVRVRVVTEAGTTPDSSADDYTFTTGPIITAVSPSTGPAGLPTFVTLTGTKFTGATRVYFGAVDEANSAEFTIGSDSQITVAAPTDIVPGVVDIRVSTPLGLSPISAVAKFTYTGPAAPPTITSITPASIAIDTAGTAVTITGTNFTGSPTVTFGGVSATDVIVVNSTTITATIPSSGTTGTVEVIVTTLAGPSATTGTLNDFIYTAEPGTLVTYTLFFRWSFAVWTGQDNLNVLSALQGLETPDNPATNNVFATVTAIFRWSDSGAGCEVALPCWLGYFPAGVGIPGANDFDVLDYGQPYWFASKGPGNITWTVIAGP